MEIPPSVELIARYQNNQQFFKKMQHISSKYREIQQMALYNQADYLQKMIISLSKQQKQWWDEAQQSISNVKIFVGYKLPKGTKSIQNILINIALLFPRPQDPYSIVFINTSADTSAYSDFKKTFEYLPLNYYTQLQHIYILHASFKTKAYNLITFDYLANYVKNKTVYEDSFERITQKLGIKYEQVIKNLPKQVIQELGKNQQLASRYLNSKRQQDKPTINQIMSKQKNPLLKDIKEYEAGQTGAPLIIELLIYFFENDNQYLKTEGLFRKNQLLKLQFFVDRDQSSSSCKYFSMYLYAIKRFLSNLQQPIILYHHFDALMNENSSNYKLLLAKIIKQLDLARKMTLLLLIEFLKERVVCLESFNLMGIENISKVLGLCIMRAKVASPKDIIFTQKIIAVTLVLFNHLEELFGNQLERLKLIRATMHAKQGQYLKEKLGNLEFLQIEEEDLALTEQQIKNLEQADQLLKHFNQRM